MEFSIGQVKVKIDVKNLLAGEWHTLEISGPIADQQFNLYIDHAPSQDETVRVHFTMAKTTRVNVNGEVEDYDLMHREWNKREVGEVG